MASGDEHRRCAPGRLGPVALTQRACPILIISRPAPHPHQFAHTSAPLAHLRTVPHQVHQLVGWLGPGPAVGGSKGSTCMHLCCAPPALLVLPVDRCVARVHCARRCSASGMPSHGQPGPTLLNIHNLPALERMESESSGKAAQKHDACKGFAYLGQGLLPPAAALTSAQE